MELINQPFTGQLGNRLIEYLEGADYHTLNIAVAFAKNSGVLRIKNGLERFMKRGGKVNAYVGIDLGGTSYEALTSLLLCTCSLNIVHSETGQTFHPKIYQFLGKDKNLIIVGSHNLTAGGLWTNFESSVLISANESNPEEMRLQSGLDSYFNDLKSLEGSFMSVGTQDDIENLLQNGYIFKEVAEQVRRAKRPTEQKKRETFFGKGAPAKLPRITPPTIAAAMVDSNTPPSLISIPHSDVGQTIWLETRSMTGGSRNILDLSMKALVELGDPKGTPFDLDDPTFMRGGVEFFGLDPATTNQVKNITINFEGIDYTDNTILFPTGNNPNGTWRLQIKGESSSGRKITDAFRAKGEAHYLVKKIVTFTIIQDDYYFMSVFPESALEDFKAASRILARNGSNRSAKQLGLL